MSLSSLTRRNAVLYCLFLLIATSVSATEPLRILYFTRSAGWEHEVVKWRDGERSHSEKILEQLAESHAFELTFSKDGSLFSPEYLEPFDVIVFYTSGDLLSEGGDGHPAMTPAGKRALLDAIEGGKGFVGVHSASDTFHTGECGSGFPSSLDGRYILHGEAADPFIRMLGGEFISHGPEQVARATVVNPRFPGFGEVGEALELHEEWYSIKEFREDLHVLLVMETDGMTGADYQRPPFPVAWARAHGQGRVWFNAMGHREDVWENADFQAILVGGIEWAGKRIDAKIPSNIDEATPQAAALPPRH